jgi:glucokinase
MKKIETRLRVLEMATEIAAEAAQNTNVIWMIEFQEELVERLFRKMISLIEDEPAEASAHEEKERTTDEEH